MVILTDENFEKEIQNNGKPVVVDFWANWCGPCNILSPILEKVAENYKEKIFFGKVNVDSAPLSSQKYNISQIPTVVLFKSGKPVSGFIGARPEEFIAQWLDENLK
jgi:thioredoxin 1